MHLIFKLLQHSFLWFWDIISLAYVSWVFSPHLFASFASNIDFLTSLSRVLLSDSNSITSSYQRTDTSFPRDSNTPSYISTTISCILVGCLWSNPCKHCKFSLPSSFMFQDKQLRCCSWDQCPSYYMRFGSAQLCHLAQSLTDLSPAGTELGIVLYSVYSITSTAQFKPTMWLMALGIK